MTFNLDVVHPSWRPILKDALNAVDADYLAALQQRDDWLPGSSQIFNAFSLPVSEVNYILLGESPYPRAQSANGYAFWDAAVTDIWSATGLSKQVNRATSFRNIIKMLLVADGRLNENQTTQTEIANLDKKQLIKTSNEFFNNLLDHGFLLLNATLVLQPGNVQKDARAWQPFLKTILDHLLTERPEARLILFGNIANLIDKLVTPQGETLYAEHPYNLSFITNTDVLNFFRPLKLLQQR